MVSKNNYLKLASYLNGKSVFDVKPYEWLESTQDMLQEFNELLVLTGLKKHMVGGSVELSKTLWSVLRPLYPVDPMYEDDLFYTTKLGYRLNGVPSKLVYILNKAKLVYDTPNVGVSMIKQSLLMEFMAGNPMGGFTVADVISNVYKVVMKPLSPYRLRAQYVGYTEVYVAETVSGDRFDTVCILPSDISDSIPDNQIQSIMYDEQLGLILDGEPLRFYNGRKGVTLSDVDLRRSI